MASPEAASPARRTAASPPKDTTVKATGIQSLDATTTTAFNGGNVIAQMAGDFNGDGKADIAHLYDYGNGHLALEVMLADSNGDGGFGQSRLVWDGPTTGLNTNHIFATAGDFNGDGKADIALFLNYTDNSSYHNRIYTLSADSNGDGLFQAPVQIWDSTTFGPGAQMITAGDFNGDGKADLALFYHYQD